MSKNNNIILNRIEHFLCLIGNQVVRKPPPAAKNTAKPPVLPPPEYEQKPPCIEQNKKV